MSLRCDVKFVNGAQGTRQGRSKSVAGCQALVGAIRFGWFVGKRETENR